MIDLKWKRLGAAALLGALLIAGACDSREENGTLTADTETGIASAEAETAVEVGTSTSTSEPVSPDVSVETNKPGEAKSPLPERLRAELDDEPLPEEQFAEWLRARAEQDNPGDYPVNVIRADLDGDGFKREWATVVYESRLVENVESRYAYGIVAALQDGKYEWHSFVFPEEDYGRASILDTGDLNGDGKPEIVWASRRSRTYRSGAQADAIPAATHPPSRPVP